MNSSRELDHLLGYKLQRVNLVAAEDAREALEPFGITPAKVAALLLVRANPGCDQTALGRALSINRSSAMKLVNFLSDSGLVERRPGRDLRSNALHLTASADERLPIMLEALRESDARLSKRLDPQEIETLERLLSKLADE